MLEPYTNLLAMGRFCGVVSYDFSAGKRYGRICILKFNTPRNTSVKYSFMGLLVSGHEADN